MNKFECRLFGHDWFRYETGKRECLHCGKRQWLFQKRYPRAGQPALRWRDMDA